MSSRLSLPAPPPEAPSTPWPIRAADLDVFGHVNNAVAWTVFEERLVDADGRTGTAEVEYPAALDRTTAQTASRATNRPTRGVRCVVAGRRRHPGAARWRPTD